MVRSVLCCWSDETAIALWLQSDKERDTHDTTAAVVGMLVRVCPGQPQSCVILLTMYLVRLFATVRPYSSPFCTFLRLTEESRLLSCYLSREPAQQSRTRTRVSTEVAGSGKRREICLSSFSYNMILVGLPDGSHSSSVQQVLPALVEPTVRLC